MSSAQCAGFKYMCPDEIMESLSEEQKGKIRTLREKLVKTAFSSIEQSSAVAPTSASEYNEMYGNGRVDGSVLHKFDDDDFQMHRFLRANEYDVDKAAEMYTKMVAWRTEFGTDTLLSDFLVDIETMKSVKKDYVHFYHRTDKLGRPIYIEQLGRLNMAGIKVRSLE